MTGILSGPGAVAVFKRAIMLEINWGVMVSSERVVPQRRGSVGMECPDEFSLELGEKVLANNSALSLE